MRSVLVFLLPLALVACSDDGEEPTFPAWNKGCGYSCGNYWEQQPQEPADEPPPAALPRGCPSTRESEARTNVTSAELRALLPGRYRSCSNGSLVFVGPETITVGACGAFTCEAHWEELGSIRVWSDPAAFTFTTETWSDGFVREEGS